jgi:hypothetical protein
MAQLQRCTVAHHPCASHTSLQACSSGQEHLPDLPNVAIWASTMRGLGNSLSIPFRASHECMQVRAQLGDVDLEAIRAVAKSSSSSAAVVKAANAFINRATHADTRVKCAHPMCAAVQQGVEYSVCGQCGITAYCSRKCQRLHWRLSHKAECKAANSNSAACEEEAAPRPGKRLNHAGHRAAQSHISAFAAAPTDSTD